MTQPAPTGQQAIKALFDLSIRFEGVLDALSKGFPSPIPPDQLAQMSRDFISLRHAVNDFINPPFVTSERVRDQLYSIGGIVKGHFVGTNDAHFNEYIAKDIIALRNSLNSEFCLGFAQRFYQDNIDVVVGPAYGEISLAVWTAYHLSWLRPDRPEVLFTFSQPEEIEVLAPRESENEGAILKHGHMRVFQGEKLILRRSGFILRPDFIKAVRGKRVLVVVNVFTTGGSAKRTAEAVVAAGGIVVGIATWVDRGNVPLEYLGVPRFESLLTIQSQVWTEEECLKSGPCSQGIKPNTDLGHGAAFLARQKQKVS